MTSKLKHSTPLCISVRKWVGSVLNSGLTFNFTQVKGRYASQSKLYILRKTIFTQKHCEVSIIITMNEMFNLAVFNIQHFKSRRFLQIYFFLCIKRQERLIKIQCALISKSYLKFRHVPLLSHGVYQGINPLKNTLPIFCQDPCKLSKPLF